MDYYTKGHTKRLYLNCDALCKKSATPHPKSYENKNGVFEKAVLKVYTN